MVVVVLVVLVVGALVVLELALLVLALLVLLPPEESSVELDVVSSFCCESSPDVPLLELLSSPEPDWSDVGSYLLVTVKPSAAVPDHA